MFFDDLSEVERMASEVGCMVLVAPGDTAIEIKNAIVLEPTEKTTITMDQVKGVLSSLTTRQERAIFIIIRPAEKLGEEAANAILKNLEEPQENVHFLLITEEPSQLLPTILSRSAVYVWRGERTPLTEIRGDEKAKNLAKRLLSASGAGLIDIAEEMTKKKEGVRGQTLAVLGVAIEMAYKSYFLTGKPAFLAKIPKLVKAYENIEQNGHIKLHLVADLL